MRRFLKLSTVQAVAALALLVGVPALFAHEEHKKDVGAPKEVTLEGEVLDLYCFMEHPEDGQGADHVKCAQSCIRKGLPIGFLSQGKVYLLLGGKEHTSAADLVVDLAGVQSRLTGMLIEHDGVTSIQVVSIAPAKKPADK